LKTWNTGNEKITELVILKKGFFHSIDSKEPKIDRTGYHSNRLSSPQKWLLRREKGPFIVRKEKIPLRYQSREKYQIVNIVRLRKRALIKYKH